MLAAAGPHRALCLYIQTNTHTYIVTYCVVKAIWNKAALPPHMHGSIVFARWRQYAPPYLTHASLAYPTKSRFQTAFQLVQLFLVRADDRERQTRTTGCIDVYSTAMQPINDDSCWSQSCSTMSAWCTVYISQTTVQQVHMRPRPCPVSERLAKQKFSHWGFPVNPNVAEIFLLSCLANRSLTGQYPRWLTPNFNARTVSLSPRLPFLPELHH